LEKYDDRGEFTAHDPNKIIGYYFLDFNEAALKEQREHHLDGSKEEALDPIPHVDNSTISVCHRHGVEEAEMTQAKVDKVSSEMECLQAFLGLRCGRLIENPRQQ